MQFSIHREYSLRKGQVNNTSNIIAILSDESLRLKDVIPSPPDASCFNCLMIFFHFLVRGREEE